MIRALAVALPAAWMISACALAQGTEAPTDTRVDLRVSLYPWIPDQETFAAWIEAEFEKENPDVDLIVRPMRIATEGGIDLAYDIGAAVDALVYDERPDYQDLVEVDTMILGALVEAGAAAPFEFARDDYWGFAEDAVRVGGVSYGVPHWTCGYFVMTLHEDVAAAESAADLRGRLESLATPWPDLGGDIKGSWQSAVVYLDAYVDTFPNEEPSDALDDVDLEPRVQAALEAIGGACADDGGQYCNRGDNEMEGAFARGELDALLGYSERLNVVFGSSENRLDPGSVRIAPAPLGDGRTAFLFTDALVMSPRCATEECRDAARRFAEFYVSDSVFEASVMSRDGTAPRTPRYLLPSTEGAFATASVSQDPIYRQLVRHMTDAEPYPNQGVPAVREAGRIGSLVDAIIHPD